MAFLALALNRLIGLLAAAHWRAQGVSIANLGYIVAGQGATTAPIQDTESYDVTTNVWTARPNKPTASAAFALVKLADGVHFVCAGGFDVNGGGQTATDEYDTGTNTWAATAAMGTARADLPGALLATGDVLVAGGWSGAGPAPVASAEIRNTGTGAWAVTGALFQARAGHTLTVLGSGKVFAIGGYTTLGALVAGAVSRYGWWTPRGATAITEEYDPATATWSIRAPMPLPRYGHAAVLLPSGLVLVLGGYALDGDAPTVARLADCQLYNPDTDKWTPAAGMPAGQADMAVTVLADGRVLACGGDAAGTAAALYTPGSDTWEDIGPLDGVASAAMLMPTGDVLVAGANDAAATGSKAAGLYDPTPNTWSGAGTGAATEVVRMQGEQIEVTGAFVGTLAVDASADGQVWVEGVTPNVVAPGVTPMPYDAAYVRARCTAWTSGNPVGKVLGQPTVENS